MRLLARRGPPRKELSSSSCVASAWCVDVPVCVVRWEVKELGDFSA